MNLNLLKSILPMMLLAFLLLFCGEPPKSEETSAESEVENNEKGVPVEAMIILSKNIEQNIPLTGILEPINAVDIVAEVNGEVEEIRKEMGQYVSLNDTLAVIDDRIPLSNFEQAKAQVLSAENSLQIASLTLESDKDLLKTGDISKLAYENSVYNYKSAEANLLAAKANLSLQMKSFEDTRIMSPIKGYVARKNIDIGTMVNMGQVLYRVVDLSTIKINVGVPQALIGSISRGDIAEIEVTGLGNGLFSGAVKYISPQADESTGSFSVEIHVYNTSDNKIRAGMTGRINLILKEEEKSLVVPDYALVTKNGNNYVYKITDGYAKLTEVKLGRSYGSSVEVYEGLTEGDEIVVVGMKNLGVNTKVWVESVN